MNNPHQEPNTQRLKLPLFSCLKEKPTEGEVNSSKIQMDGDTTEGCSRLVGHKAHVTTVFIIPTQ